MAQPTIEIPLAKWQVAATTIHCDFIGDFVTILVYKDWTSKCIWYQSYKQKALENKEQKFDSKTRAKIEKCAGSPCRYVTEYRDKLIKEEFKDK